MPESENRTKYAVNPETGQVMRNDGTGWKKVQTAKNQAGDILINENGVWGPVPGRSAQPAPAGFASVPKMSMGQAAQIAGAQGREIGLSDEARGFRAMAGIPEGLNQVYQAVNPLGRFTSIGTGLAGLAGEAMGVMPKSYEQARDVARGELTQARTDRPVTSFLAEMGEGAVYPAGTLRMGAPIVSQSLKMAGIGGLYGGATGYAGAEGDTEQRLGSAALYGGLGAGIGAITPGGVAAALPVFRAGKTAVAKAVDAIVNLFGGTGTASEQAAREVAEAAVRRSMERSNMTPERIAEVVERFRDKPAVLAEVIGQDAINALSSLTRRPGSTSQAAQDIIADRMGGFAGRAADDIRQVTGLTDAQIRGNFAPELQARREAAAPVYEELFQQQGNVASERLTALSSTNTLGPLIRRAQAAAEDLAVTQRRNPASVTPLEVLDLAKRELDDQIATAQRNQQNSELFRLQSLQSALLEELDALTGGQYATARQVGGEAPRLEEARMQGEQALRPSVTRATVQEQVSALNPQDRSFFASGAASKLDEDIAGGRMDPRRFRLPAMQEKVGAAFGDEAGADLTRRMTAEAELRDLAARWGPRQGSITGTVLESGPSEMLDEGIRFATALARGDRIGIVNQAISFMRRRGYTQRQIDEMGRLLLSNPQEGLRRLGVRLPTAPNTGAAGIAAPNAFTGGSPEGPAGGSGPAGPQGPSGGSMPSGGGVAAMPEANPFAGPQMAPEPAGNAFTSPYFGRQSMRAARERGPSERVLAMQADWAPVSESMSQARMAAEDVADMAQQATMIRTGPERQAAAEQAAQMMQAVRRQVQDIQAQRAGMATPEDQRLQDLIDLLEPTNNPVLLQTQATMVQQNLARINQAIGVEAVPRSMPPQQSAARRLGFQPTVRDETAVARERPIAGRYAGARDDIQPMGFGASAPKTPQQAVRFETPGSPEYEAAVAKGLDMSTPARMARAREMGFDTDTVLYHGTPDANFEEFNPSLAGASQRFKRGQALPGMSFAYGPGAASLYAGGANSSPAIIPVFAKAKNPLDLRNLGDFTDQSFWDKLRASGVQTKKTKPVSAEAGKDFETRIYEYLDAGGETLAKQIQAAGYDAIIFTEPASGQTFHIFDPSNIRSVHAAFDPDKAASSQLMAGFPSPNAFVEAGAGSIGGSVAGQQYDITGDGVIDERDVQAGALLGMAGVPAIGAAARRMGRNALAQGDMQTMGIGGDVPKPVQQARQTGYEGADTGESKEWLSAVGKGLPMDTESRMARAKEQGYEGGFFKGMWPYDHTKEVGSYKGPEIDRIQRTTPFPSFGGKDGDVEGVAGFITKDPKVAERFAGQKGYTLPLMYRPGRVFEIDAKGDFAGNIQFGDAGKPFRDAIRSKNYDTIIIRNTRDEGDVYVALESSNIRSVHAAFDPEKSSSPNLLAGISPNAFVEAGIGSVGGSVAGQQYDITGDGVIDERDMQAGALMGMAGIPLAARMMRGGGSGMRGMGYTGEMAKPQIADRFFSGLQKAVQGMKPQRASAEQWKGMLNNAPGVKKEELEWTGVMDWLDAQEGQVSKADLDAYVRGNGVQVDEIVKGGAQPEEAAAIQRDLLPLIEQRDRIVRNAEQGVDILEIAENNGMANLDDMLDNGDISRDTYNRVSDVWDLSNEIQALEDELSMLGNGSDTKFSTFTLPGGENYTELLLTLPPAEQAIERKAAGILKGRRVVDLSPEERAQIDALNNQMAGVQDYRSSHWSEPNVLAHVRFKDRTGPNGERILAMEEIQSDWHQAGRERGYRGQTQIDVRKDAGGIWRAYDSSGQRLSSIDGTSGWTTEDGARAGIQARISEFDKGVPNAPFKNNAWVNLALNRMIRKAAEEGYDGISWIPGNVQNGSIVNAADNRGDFYDKIVVNAANKIGKKYGAKATRLDGVAKTEEGQPVNLHYLPITPEMKNKALQEGFPLFAGLPFAVSGAGLGMGAMQSEERPNAFVQ